MKYRRLEAKDYAKANMKGIWAAAMTPFAATLQLDEAGFRHNLRHWIEDLSLGGLFISGKQGEFCSLSPDERKRTFELAVDEARGRCGTIMNCSDQNLDTVIDLAKHAEAIGSDYIVVHAPILHFLIDVDDTVYEYFRYISQQIEIGIAMWSHSDSGYLMSPELCTRAVELPNIVAIKYSVPRDMCAKLTTLAGGKILVSTALEEEWFDNIVELGWQLYLSSPAPYLLQTKTDQRMRDYTEFAMRGDIGRARAVHDSLEPVRHALKSSRPAGKPHAHQKYWQELLGQVGGPVRRPLLQLTDEERAATKAAFESCGLDLDRGAVKEEGQQTKDVNAHPRA
jgi:4-hydroxy-tetrahydrodipicolinate synthase